MKFHLLFCLAAILSPAAWPWPKGRVSIRSRTSTAQATR